MGKVKMRCTTCGKWFQSANAKEVTCPDCVQKARKEKLAAKVAPPANQTAGASGPLRSTPPPPKPKPAASGTNHWLDEVSDVKIGQPDQPQKPKLPSSPAPRDSRGGQDASVNRGPGGYRDRDERGSGPGGYRERDRGPGGYRDRDERGPNNYRPGGGPGNYRESGYRPGGYRPGGPGTLDTPGYRPRQPMEGGFNRGPRPGPGAPGDTVPGAKRDSRPPKAKTAKPSTPPRPKREKIPPPTPFVPTPEQVTQVETRYLELATPQEFDGIRTQIASELSIPRKAVKKIVHEFRERNHIPSWWESQVYKGDSEELAKIKAAYEPFLPVPPVGVHKKISDELSLKAGIVYQAIKAIRLEMNLPQFNDPELHGEELTARGKKEASSNDTSTGEETRDEAPSTSDAATPIEEAAVTNDATPAAAAVPSESEEAQPSVENAEEENNAAENS